MMLGSCDVIAFVATAEPARARGFYEEILGLRVMEDGPFAIVFDANGTMLRVQKVGESAPAPFTVLGWAVADVADAVTRLSSRGVTFERYEGMEQDALGIWASPGGGKIAWFKDPDGNTLSLAQFS
jgi:catechol 2,3-dioxygenase-like lactoylglutathione lyase family enzyme